MYGVGETKLRDFGPQFLDLIRSYGQAHGLMLDLALIPTPWPAPAPTAAPERGRSRPTAAGLAFALFREGTAIEDVMHQLNRARPTVLDYLADFVRTERPASIAPWVPEDVYHRVAEAARQVGTGRLKPIFLALGQTVDYDSIRLVVSHRMGGEAPA